MKRNKKYGTNLPKTVQEALMFDKYNGNTLWSDEITKEMTYVKVTKFLYGKMRRDLVSGVLYDIYGYE